jgi:hypothetical protein
MAAKCEFYTLRFDFFTRGRIYQAIFREVFKAGEPNRCYNPIQ